jgi:hypothetical protein
VPRSILKQLFETKDDRSKRDERFDFVKKSEVGGFMAHRPDVLDPAHTNCVLGNSINGRADQAV